MDIVFWPSKVLETKSEEVTEFDSELSTLIDSMKETMRSAGGIGLAANQVNVLKRIALINIQHNDPNDLSPDDEDESDDTPFEQEEKQSWHDKMWVLVNPVITKQQGKTKYQEGCLSFPDVFEIVQRSDEVWVKAQDENGKEYEVHGTGLFAIALQHEIDHLDGKTFVSRMGRLKSSIVRKKMMRRGAMQNMQLGDS